MATDNLAEKIPDFNGVAPIQGGGPVDVSALASVRRAKGFKEISKVLLLGILVVTLLEFILIWTKTPLYIFPRPTLVIKSLFHDFGPLYRQPLLQTVQEFFVGLAFGASIGLALAVLVTLKPGLDIFISPYIIIMVTTPMIALIPFLMLKFGFGMTPRVIAVALASGPMVMINSATGFRRTNAELIALGKSYGATEFQLFRKIRFPFALPMIIVGFMVGSIFGLLTAVGSEMVGGGGGLGNRLVYFSSLVRMANFGAVLVIVATFGVALYSFFTFVNRKYASWQV
ncbi:MAG: ABC transporter permease subunit [Actinobacteria bacterium]|jgi:NitT/TauT family transport system permease protein|nr:ABC transporter permease subunit [Actinomycetota bacterium]